MGFLSDLPWSFQASILYAFLIQWSANLILLVSVTLVIRLVNRTNFKSSSVVKFLQTFLYFMLLVFRGQMYVTVYFSVLLPIYIWSNKLTEQGLCKKIKPAFFNKVNHTVLLATYITTHSFGWRNTRWKLCVNHPIFISTFNTYLRISNFGSMWMLFCEPGISVSIATDYGLNCPGSNPGVDEIFRPFRPALGPTQHPVKWVPGLSRR